MMFGAGSLGDSASARRDVQAGEAQAALTNTG